MNNWNKLFWLLFIAAGALMISGVLRNLFFAEIVLGLLLIALGLAKIGEEMSDRTLRRSQERVKDSLEYLTMLMESNHEFSKKLKDKHEIRLSRLDKKRAATDTDVHKKHRLVASKIIDIENKLSKVSKAIVRRR